MAEKLCFHVLSFNGNFERIFLSNVLPRYNTCRRVKDLNIVTQGISKSSFSTTTQKSQHDEHNIVHSPFPDIRVPNVPFSKFIWDDNATLRGNKIALVRSIAIRFGIRL